jgi:septal ring factor EnvC (AmiA/AmiB activator)
VTDQLWTNERIDGEVISRSTYHDDADNQTLWAWVYALSASTAEELMQAMRDEYEAALTTQKAIIVKQAQKVEDLESQVKELETNLAKWRVIVAEVTVDRS